MTYTPNFRDLRIQRRITAAITAVEQYVKPQQVYSIAQSQRRAWFGTLSNPVSHWLDSHLLETADPHWNMATGQCIKYRLREQNLHELKTQLGITSTYVPTPEVQTQIDTGDFEYELKSDRWYTSAQFIASRIRGPLLANAGYRYAYDIEAAAPTILLQRAQQHNPDFVAPALLNYIHNRTQVRNQIATEANCTTDQIKTLLNAVLQGSVISTWSSNKLFCALNHDYDLIHRLKLSQTLTAIRSDIKRLWQCLRDEFPRECITYKNGSERTRKLSARQKSAYYRQFENEVARAIQKSLRKQNTRFLWVHDGWQCDKAIDPVELAQQVRRQTGFVIKLDWAVYED
jgi:hypothetical protein